MARKRREPEGPALNLNDFFIFDCAARIAATLFVRKTDSGSPFFQNRLISDPV